ncbi:MAG: right-handed parallel beta-helix repeat-containing protein [Candidatus Zixiibacteriota bacterium]|nr:MAG: right-handed parallel beta-helix repeat-containing protein [candidate division Zixibacteria bacterium]
MIDGDSAGSVVRFESGESNLAVLYGFKLQNGLSQFGGGVYCNNSSPRILYNHIINNRASSNQGSSGHGGGIYINNSNVEVDVNLIANNTTYCASNYGGNGGGIYCANSIVQISNNEIFDNFAYHPFGGGYGGGIYCEGGDVLISNNHIYDNITPYEGGGILIRTSSNVIVCGNVIYQNEVYYGDGGGIYLSGTPVISNNIIYGNEAYFDGGGIFSAMWGHPLIINCTIVGNTAGDSGGAIHYLDPGSSHIINSILWDNYPLEFSGPWVCYSNIQGSYYGEENISVDPLFRDPSNRDYKLMSTEYGFPYDSPCIDAGHPNHIDSLLSINFGLGNIRSDMGAFGGGDSTLHVNWILNVPGDYMTIQSAIASSRTGDTVLVSPGIYFENINLYRRNIILGSQYIMTGDTSFISSTIIDGDSTGSVITFENGEGHSTKIIGFTIINGYAYNGAGVHCHRSSPTISNNVIVDNWSMAYGGGIYCYISNAIINTNIIKFNTADSSGGGIYCGLFSRHVNIAIANNIIVDNIANNGGGIILSEYSNPWLINNVISENHAFYGGGISCIEYSDPYIVNNILWNDSSLIGSEIYLDSTFLPIVNYCDIKGGYEGYGNVNIDPLFRDPLNRDYHLMSIVCGDNANSPCIDIGSPDFIDTLLDCSWGLGSTESDMGAYGGGDYSWLDVYNDIETKPEEFMLLQNYPNPFNAQTTIRFVLRESQNVQLTIYDLLGRRVETLIDEYRQAGVHAVMFDASGISSGVYFYRLEVGDRIETKRMVLLK